MSIITFLFVLFVLVLVHELGHFAIAKWTGMRVDEFGIGFPPKLFGIRRGETEYTLNLFPIGGFVKIYGEDALVDTDGGTGVDAKGRSFTSKSKWAQSAVLVAGITMNIIFAWILITLAFGLGVKSSVTEQDATDTAVLAITGVLPGSPAERASLTAGTVVQEVRAGDDTLATLTPSAFSSFIETHADTPVTVSYTLGGEMRAVQITPESREIDGTTRPAIGVALTLIDTVSRSFTESVVDASVYTVRALRDITHSASGHCSSTRFVCVQIFHRWRGRSVLWGLSMRRPRMDSLRFSCSLHLFHSTLRSSTFCLFLRSMEGRLLFVAIEAVKGSPIKATYVGVLNTIGFFLLILLMVLVTWNDIAKL
jgi:regulator of sigma E protease